MGAADLVSLASCTQSLPDSGRLDEAEHLTSISLAQQQEKQRRQTSVPAGASPSHQLATVSAVFNTVELVEQIFCHLDMMDLVKGTSMACHAFRNIANTTPILRRKLFLQAEETAVFRMPAVRNVHHNIVSGYVQILIVNAGATIGSSAALRSMLLSQPPPKSLQIFYDCLCKARDAGIVEDAYGLTFGHIDAAVNEHFKESRASALASRRCKCPTYIEARLVFKLSGL